MQTLRQNRSKKGDFTESMFKLTGLESGTRRQSKQANKSRGATQAGRQVINRQQVKTWAADIRQKMRSRKTGTGTDGRNTSAQY